MALLKMNYTKTALMPIKVPDCDYCWEPYAPHRICGHFDNEGGHPTCGLNLGTLEYGDEGGVRKPSACTCLANDQNEGSCPVPCSVLADAVKRPISMRGQALLQWGFGRKVSFPEHSIQMPEAVVDQILAWRDAAQNDSGLLRRAKEGASK